MSHRNLSRLINVDIEFCCIFPRNSDGEKRKNHDKAFAFILSSNMSKGMSRLETIYEDDEEKFVEENSNLLPTASRTRLPCYICWSIIASCFLLITIIIAFSLNPIPSDLQTKVKSFHSDYDIPLFNNYNQLRSARKLIKSIDQFSQQVNEQLNLPPDTITVFTLTISSQPVDFSSPGADLVDNAILGVYSHLQYPSFCWDNYQCRGNFQGHLNQSLTKLSELVTGEPIPHQHELIRCSSIENSTSTTSIAYLSTVDSTPRESKQIVKRQFCDQLDHYYLVESIFHPRQRHHNLINRPQNGFDTPQQQHAFMINSF